MRRERQKYSREKGSGEQSEKKVGEVHAGGRRKGCLEETPGDGLGKEQSSYYGSQPAAQLIEGSRTPSPESGKRRGLGLKGWRGVNEGKQGHTREKREVAGERAGQLPLLAMWDFAS